MDPDQSSSGDKSASSGGSSSNKNDDNNTTLGYFEDLVRQSRAQRTQRAQRARKQQRTAAGSTSGGGGNTGLGPVAMFLCGVVAMLAIMYLTLKFSGAADHHHYDNNNNINDVELNGGGGFFNLSERRRGTPRGSTWDAAQEFLKLEHAAEQVSAILNGSSSVGRQALDAVMDAATGDYEQLRYVGDVLNSTRSTMATAANLGRIAASTFDCFFALVEGSSTHGTAAAVSQFERKVASINAQVKLVKETLSGQTLCPNLAHRLDILRLLDSLLADYEQKLDRRLARPASYLDNQFTTWLAGRTTVAALELEQAALRHLRGEVRNLIGRLETSTRVLDKYVGELKDMVDGGVVGDAEGWTQMDVLRSMVKAGNRDVGKLVGANYEILLEKLEKVRLSMS